MRLIFHAVLLAGLGMFISGCGATELNIDFQQSDYHLKFERMELIHYNKTCVKEASAVTYKYNRTTAVINVTATFNYDLGYGITIIVQAYKFMSNEYRTFPLRFALSACKALAANTIGVRSLMDCGNFTGCPIKKGKYHICNWRPDQSKFPPFIPNGEYKIELQYLHSSMEVGVGTVYVTVTRPIKYI